MKRPNFRLTQVAVLGLLWATCILRAPLIWGAAEPGAAKQPNVVLILIDDLGATDLGCYGSKFYRTPNIDRLAAAGMRFLQAYSACPVCSPTRAALLTGKFPARLQLTDYIPGQPNQPTHKLLRAEFRQELPLAETTLAEALAAAGYATGSIGKWHLGDQGFEPQRQGFAVAKGGIARGSVPSHFAPYLKEGELPGLENPPAGEYLADRLTTEAEKFIESNRERPFFLYLPHYAVHTPIMAKPEWEASYSAAVASGAGGLQRNAAYAGMVENMDESVGRILKKLDELKLARDTIVIFTSDNGGLATAEGNKTPATNNAPLREGKGYLYEGGIRVPFIVRWPEQIKPGSTCATPVSSYDVLPTVLELCGASAQPKVDGVSLAPLVRQTGEIQREALYWHYPHYSPQGGKPGGAIRAGDYKLIEFYEQGRRELYNITKDGSESTNLIDVEAARAAQLAEKLAAFRRETAATMTQPNPDFKPDAQAADGTIRLPARNADIHGVMVRYEPLPHKNTIGFWVRPDDWVSWDFDVEKPGEFRLQVLQGCGHGSGGSQVEYVVGDQTLSAVVKETGGFQKFEWVTIGTLKLDKPGRHTLRVRPLKKPGAAVMDLREVRLEPAT